ncbi:MAG: YihY/virulence factor BrkB family protein, partial [Ardenticatenaceae bacterium]
SWSQVRKVLANRNSRIGSLFLLLGETWRSFNDDDGGTHAAAIGYFALFSLFPLVVLLTLSLTLFVADTTARVYVLFIVSRYLPRRLGVVDEIIQNVLENRGTLSILAIVGVLWGSIHIFRVLERSINQAWGAPQRRQFWSHLRFSVIMITITGLLSSISLVLPVVFRLVQSISLPVAQWAPLDNEVVSMFVSALPSFALTTALFLLLYRFVPHRVNVAWRDVWPGALLAAFLWEGAKRAFAVYLASFAQQSYNLLYGSLGAIIGLLTWVYVTGYIVVMGAELCAALSRRRREERGK